MATPKGLVDRMPHTREPAEDLGLTELQLQSIHNQFIRDKGQPSHSRLAAENQIPKAKVAASINRFGEQWRQELTQLQEQHQARERDDSAPEDLMPEPAAPPQPRVPRAETRRPRKDSGGGPVEAELHAAISNLEVLPEMKVLYDFATKNRGFKGSLAQYVREATVGYSKTKYGIAPGIVLTAADGKEEYQLVGAGEAGPGQPQTTPVPEDTVGAILRRSLKEQVEFMTMQAQLKQLTAFTQGQSENPQGSIKPKNMDWELEDGTPIKVDEDR